MNTHRVACNSVSHFFFCHVVRRNNNIAVLQQANWIWIYWPWCTHFISVWRETFTHRHLTTTILLRLSLSPPVFHFAAILPSSIAGGANSANRQKHKPTRQRIALKLIFFSSPFIWMWMRQKFMRTSNVQFHMWVLLLFFSLHFLLLECMRYGRLFLNLLPYLSCMQY